jgi:hypothetical protein
MNTLIQDLRYGFQMTRGEVLARIAAGVSRKEVEGGNMAGTYTTEITPVRGNQGFQLQPLGYSHHRGVHEAKKIVPTQQLRTTGQVSLTQIFHHKLSRGQRLRKGSFDLRPETCSDQVRSFSDHCAGSQQCLAAWGDKLPHRFVPGVISVRQGIERARVKQEWHQSRRSRRGLPPWGTNSLQRSSS